MLSALALSTALARKEKSVYYAVGSVSSSTLVIDLFDRFRVNDTGSSVEALHIASSACRSAGERALKTPKGQPGCMLERCHAYSRLSSRDKVCTLTAG
jgi:hypothetical protein